MLAKLDRPRLQIDFNERLEDDLFLLSKGDQARASDGKSINLSEGLHVFVFEGWPGDDPKDVLLADGMCVRNTDLVWSQQVKWCVRLNSKGIYSLDEVL